MKLAILLLCHEPAKELNLLLSNPFFISSKVKVYIHYDAKRSPADLKELLSHLPSNLQFSVVLDRVDCRWGEFSLVKATHRLLKLALLDSDFVPDYLFLSSGSCTPFRPLASLLEFLRRRRGYDFIQTHDISQSKWIKDGLESERYKYFFPFNFITQRRLFERATALQRQLRISRPAPKGLRIHFGSQWFCLTRDTSSKVAHQLDKPDLQNFFKHSWIPDEFAIQTLVANCQNTSLIAGHCLTYYEFDRGGRPLVLENGHTAHLLNQPFFFARKIASEALGLKSELISYCSSSEYDVSYFDEVGKVTSDYQRFQVEAMLQKSSRTHVGSVKDPWRGPMEVSNRRYYVLYSSSRPYLLELLSTARRMSGLPIFDLPFERADLLLAKDTSKYFGFQFSDKWRRDYDPAAFLHEMVHVDARNSAAFGINHALNGWVRDFVRWDKNAVLINCDPLDVTPAQCLAAFTKTLESSQDIELLAEVIQASQEGKPGPHQHFHQVWMSKEHACTFEALHVERQDASDATLAALQGAAQWVDALRFFPRPVTSNSLLAV
jgi:hypothetical protein